MKIEQVLFEIEGIVGRKLSPQQVEQIKRAVGGHKFTVVQRAMQWAPQSEKFAYSPITELNRLLSEANLVEAREESTKNEIDLSKNEFYWIAEMVRWVDLAMWCVQNDIVPKNPEPHCAPMDISQWEFAGRPKSWHPVIDRYHHVLHGALFGGNRGAARELFDGSRKKILERVNILAKEKGKAGYVWSA